MQGQDPEVVVGLDNGGNKNNATVVDVSRRFLVDRLVETPSRVQEGPEIAVEALVQAYDGILERTGIPRARVRAVGLDTPGPASADGVISSRGSTNFAHHGWRVSLPPAQVGSLRRKTDRKVDRTRRAPRQTQ